MVRTALNISSFVLGLLLSVVVVYQGNVALFIRSLLPNSAAVAMPDVRSTLPSTTVRPSVQREQPQYELLLAALPQSERLELIRHALEQGTLESLQMLRPSYLQQIPNYETEFHQAVEEEALKALLVRFQESDWRDWKNALFQNGGGPSRARLFVDDVTTVNRRLGRVLETAAQLFHGLYLKTSQGEPYVLERDLAYVLVNADDLLFYRKNAAIPARDHFLTDIAKNRTFLAMLENIRGQLVAAFIESRPTEVDRGLRLLASIQPEFVGSETFQAAGALLTRVAVDGSPRFRAEVVGDEKLLGVVREMAQRDARVGVTLGRVHLAASFDAIERGDLEVARTQFAKAEELAPQLANQPAIRSFVAGRLGAQKVQEPAREAGVNLSKPEVPQSRPAQEPSSVSSISILFFLVLAALVLGAAGVVFGFVRARLALVRHERAVRAEAATVGTDAVVSEAETPEQRRKKFLHEVAPERRVANSK